MNKIDWNWHNFSEQAVVYDIETFPNAFTLDMQMLGSEVGSTWEISHYRDDRQQLMQWFNHLFHTQTPGIGFNNLHFDYPVLHFIYSNPGCTVEAIYAKAMEIIKGNNRFAHMIWPSDRFFPQVDLFKIHHFDNKAKTTSLKALEINMRSESVVDMPVELGTMLQPNDINERLIPYNKHDVKETKKFAHISKTAIEFRLGLIDQFGLEVLNYNDTKIGEKILEKRIGDDVCYDRSSGRKKPRQTVRNRIALADIIFPYIRFENPEFNRVLDYMKSQVLTPDDIDDPENSTIKTKGVFKDLHATVGGLQFHFGTGGIHGSVEPQRIVATDEWLIRDIDVASLYPSIAVVNRLAPRHLGEVFATEYAGLLTERKKHKKGTVQNASLKLAANGTYGKSNSKFSVFYDPQFTLTITINGQLMLCMLAEWLLKVPTLQLIQINTDGITYRIHRDYEPQAAEICGQWEVFTLLVLEGADYSRMWIRDVNNYVAEDKDGKLKQKGAYWHPDPFDYDASISNASPPAWHKDFNPLIVPRAAVMAMVHGIDPELFIKGHTNPFDFMCRAKVDRASKLYLGNCEIQGTTRYYIAREGQPLRKISPPTGPEGAYKKKAGVSDAEYQKRMAETNWEWCETVCTKNRSKYEQREMSICAGWKVADCNIASNFDFRNLNYDYYIQEARKLLI